MAVVALVLFASGLPVMAGAGSKTPEQRAARMQWFNDARFGMFIHWGVYAVPAGEWEGKTGYGEWIMESAKIPVSRYEQFANKFNPTKFDAKQWAALAKRAGMKYVVITSKHHDGFAMFDSKVGDWGIMHTPYARDPMKDLSEACRAEGLKFCFYHSIMDWHHPDYAPRRPWNDVAQKSNPDEPDYDRYVQFMKAQLRELLTNYGPLGILWFDGEWEGTWTDARGRDLYEFVRSIQPDIIINNRVAKSRGGMAGMSKGEDTIGDYGTPEQQIPATGFGPGVYWESCMTMNHHWGYNAHDKDFKSTRTLVRMLIDCASKGGNFLLNVGPTAEGLIPPESVDRLEEIGRWMDVNGEAIYGTGASPFKKLKWGRATTRGNLLYLHVFDWPGDGTLMLPLRNTPKSAAILGEHRRVDVIPAGENGLALQLGAPQRPTAAEDALPVVIRLELERPPEVIPVDPTIQADADGTLTCLAEDAEIRGSTAMLETIDGKTSVGHWTDKDDSIAWPSVQLAAATRYRVVLDYAAEPGSGGAQLVVTVGEQRLDATIAATSSWHDFKSIELGELRTESAAPPVEVRVAATSRPGIGVMNLRSVKLAPVTGRPG